MAYIGDSVFDKGLEHVNNGGSDRELRLTKTEVTAFAQLSTESVATTAGGGYFGASGPSDSASGGREIVITASGTSSVVSAQTANAWCAVDTANSEVLISGPLVGGITINPSEAFDLTSFTVRIPDPA